VLLAATAALADIPSIRPQLAARAVAAWFASEAPGDQPIAVDDQTWSALIVGGVPAARLQRRVDGAAWWVTRDALHVSGWPEYAIFGTGAGALHVSRRQTAAGSEGDQVRRASVGAQLAENPSLHLAAPAAAELLAGQVDLRLIFLLAQLGPKIPLTIADFPSVPGEYAGGTALRRILITQVDGRAAIEPDPGHPGRFRPAAAADLTLHWFAMQLDPYKPCGIDANDAGLLVRYCVAPPQD
jgi:hypothetical protein